MKISAKEWRRVGSWLTIGVGLILLYLAVEEWARPRLSLFGMFFWGLILLVVGAYVFNINQVRL